MIYFKQVDDIMFQEDEDGKYILFNPRTSSVHVLTTIGFEIWNNCKNNISLNEIICLLKNQNILDETIENEEYVVALEDFIQQLIKRGLIITKNEPDNLNTEGI